MNGRWQIRRILPGRCRCSRATIYLARCGRRASQRWLEGLSEAHNFARTQAAELGGLLAGFAVPCCSSGSVFAVLEFFSHLSLSPDPALLTLLANAAAQIGLHMDSACAQSRALQAEQDRQLTVAIAQTSQVRFQQVLDTILDLVLVKRPDSQIVWVNATMRAYGMPPDGSGPIAEAPFNAPRNTQPYLADDVHVFATRQTLVIPVEAVTRFDGQVRYFHVVKPPIFDDQGRVAMLVIVCCYLGR